eukprot:scaffold2633_cov156-Amphora_coffeaeformis.AAC.5
MPRTRPSRSRRWTKRRCHSYYLHQSDDGPRRNGWRRAHYGYDSTSVLVPVIGAAAHFHFSAVAMKGCMGMSGFMAWASPCRNGW